MSLQTLIESIKTITYSDKSDLLYSAIVALDSNGEFEKINLLIGEYYGLTFFQDVLLNYCYYLTSIGEIDRLKSLIKYVESKESKDVNYIIALKLILAEFYLQFG